jgi:hypothetical protein
VALDGVLALDRAGVGHGGGLARLVVVAGAAAGLGLALQLRQELALSGCALFVGLHANRV